MVIVMTDMVSDLNNIYAVVLSRLTNDDKKLFLEGFAEGMQRINRSSSFSLSDFTHNALFSMLADSSKYCQILQTTNFSKRLLDEHKTISEFGITEGVIYQLFLKYPETFLRSIVTKYSGSVDVGVKKHLYSQYRHLWINLLGKDAFNSYLNHLKSALTQIPKDKLNDPVIKDAIALVFDV